MTRRLLRDLLALAMFALASVLAAQVYLSATHAR